YKDFMKRGDYYDTSFSDSLIELKEDICNTTVFVYLAMFGIAHATKNFTSYFRFTQNDWDYSYTDIDVDLKEKLVALNINDIMDFISKSDDNKELFKSSFFTVSNSRICNSLEAKALGLLTPDDFIKNNVDDSMYGTISTTKQFFADTQVFIALRFLQKYLGDLSTPMQFTQNIKKAFGISTFPFTYGNKPFVRAASYNSTELRVLK
ncbi:MAG: hypothetical protein RR372_06555, partial [Oscillospiraceae bacterium]